MIHFDIMCDSSESSQPFAPASGRWLLLIHQIPAKPDYLRVKVRRRLHHIGAVALKNSVYVLPHTDDALEDFQWVHRMVADAGGEATICGASFLGGIDDAAVRALFRDQADEEYREVLHKARALASDPAESDVARLRDELSRIGARDHFQADLAAEAALAVRRIEDLLASGGEDEPNPFGVDLPPPGSTWVTRAGIQVDRMASAWLVRRFLDPIARFTFVSPDDHLPQTGEIRFDMFEGEFTHQGENCTFEGLVKRFTPSDPALQRIAEIVHDVDCKDGKFARDEAAGLASMVRGIAASHAEDADRLDAGMVLFDGLYAAFRAEPA